MLSLLEKNSASLQKFDLDSLFEKLKSHYGYYEISEERKTYLREVVQKYGYLPYSHIKSLEELSSSEVIFAFEQKLIKEGTFADNQFVKHKNPSPLARHGVKNSSWFKKEGHNIKLISLAGQGEGNRSEEPGKFIHWLAQVITMPSGNHALGVFPSTIYLIPFHPREFGCAYLPMSSDVSLKLEDPGLRATLNLDVNSQVKLFITLAQLSGHPVIYDVLPQTARYSKIVLSKPWVARWLDVNELIDKIVDYLDVICKKIELENTFTQEDIKATRKLYIEILKGSKSKYSKNQEEIAECIEEDMREYKILISYRMTFKENQEEILKKVYPVIERTNGKKPECERDVVKQPEIIKALIKEGLWPAPGGAWCSAGVPVFDKMNEHKEYPLFRHYNNKAEDVTHFANLDCQTPYFFFHFETKKYNKKVIDFYLDYTKKLQQEFNFDGFRVDHIDHIVDDISQQNGSPISYRSPSKVLNAANVNIKRSVPYFATLAEYMLWDDFYKEYHKGMHFDLLWGNDIVSQSSKTPAQIIEDNEKLALYNKKYGGNSPLSILKTYNNQDGEFEAIDQYPGQLGQEGALFKWFKYKFLPGGKYAARPALYVDGDESFTKTGVEKIICKEVSMKRSDNWQFYERFDAINRFVENSPLILNGKASLLCQDEEGFAAWKITQEDSKCSLSTAFLVVANYHAPTERVTEGEGDEAKKVTKKGKTIHNKTVILEENEKISTILEFCYDEHQKVCLCENALEQEIVNTITFNTLHPSEFRVYGVTK